MFDRSYCWARSLPNTIIPLVYSAAGIAMMLSKRFNNACASHAQTPHMSSLGIWIIGGDWAWKLCLQIRGLVAGYLGEKMFRARAITKNLDPKVFTKFIDGVCVVCWVDPLLVPDHGITLALLKCNKNCEDWSKRKVRGSGALGFGIVGPLDNMGLSIPIDTIVGWGEYRVHVAYDLPTPRVTRLKRLEHLVPPSIAALKSNSSRVRIAYLSLISS